MKQVFVLFFNIAADLQGSNKWHTAETGTEVHREDPDVSGLGRKECRRFFRCAGKEITYFEGSMSERVASSSQR